jgi:hypothetical protein
MDCPQLAHRQFGILARHDSLPLRFKARQTAKGRHIRSDRTKDLEDHRPMFLLNVSHKPRCSSKTSLDLSLFDGCHHHQLTMYMRFPKRLSNSRTLNSLFRSSLYDRRLHKQT